MRIDLIRVNKLLYSKSRINHLKKYGCREYGLDFCCNNDGIKKLEKWLGEYNKFDEKDQVFEILIQNREVGSIIYKMVNDPIHNRVLEMSVEIFDEFSGNKIAQNAIEKSICIIRENYNYNIDAIMSNENRNYKRMEHLLKKSGFKLQ